MPVFEPDQESFARAARLSARLMEDVGRVSEGPVSVRRELFTELRYTREADNVPISDVLASVGQMATEFAMARRWDNKIPCLKVEPGMLAPISVTEFMGFPQWPFLGSSPDWFELWDEYFPFPFGRFWRDIFRHVEEWDEGITTRSVQEIREDVERNLSTFLAYRFGGMKEYAKYKGAPVVSVWISRLRRFLSPPSGRQPSGSSSPIDSVPPPPAAGYGGGLHVEVSCKTSGLRLHVSPAYFINWVYFGSPTTPVSGYVLPGRYVFAGDGPMLPKRTADRGVFCIPPTYRPVLTRF